jgi:hypothetical protein
MFDSADKHAACRVAVTSGDSISVGRAHRNARVDKASRRESEGRPDSTGRFNDRLTIDRTKERCVDQEVERCEPTSSAFPRRMTPSTPHLARWQLSFAKATFHLFLLPLRGIPCQTLRKRRVQIVRFVAAAASSDYASDNPCLARLRLVVWSPRIAAFVAALQANLLKGNDL